MVAYQKETIAIDDSAEEPEGAESGAPQESAFEYSDSRCQEHVPPAMPASVAPFLSFRVANTNLPVLEAVQRTHPETFANFRAQSPLGGGMLLDNLATIITSLEAIPLKKFGHVSLQDGREALMDLQNLGGLEVGWLIAHMERMHRSRRAFKIPLRVEVKQREVERAQERVDLTCAALAQRETDLRERQAELEAILCEKAEFEAAGGEIFGKNDPVSKGLFPDPPQ